MKFDTKLLNTMQSNPTITNIQTQIPDMKILSNKWVVHPPLPICKGITSETF